MKEQIKLLLEVQRHDAKLQELENLAKAFPLKLEELRGDVRKMEALLTREREQLHDTEKWRRNREDELKAEEERATAAKQKAGLVKNVREHMASERELQSTRERSKEHEEEVAKLGAATEEAKARVKKHEEDFAAFKKHIEEEEAEAKKGISDIEKQLKSVRKAREAEAAKVKPDVLKKYSAIRMKRGLAMVPVKNGTCQGCNMNIPPQVYNLLQRGDSLELCGNCNRIIFWDKFVEESAASEKSA